MAYNSTKEYLNIVDRLTDAYNIPKNIIDPLLGYLKPIYRSELEDRFSAPMLWIGMYIALASLVCILAMVADLMHGLRSRKLWFPSKYFRINSAFLTVISVAMKLPVDLTSSMPGYVDQVAKLGSMAFMCTIMANLLPCLGTMESNDILSNTISMCILAVTLVVNVCIQMQTGAVAISTHKEDPRIIQLTSPTHISANPNSVLPFIYVILLVVLLIIYICSSLALLRSIQIIEDKYQAGHNAATEEIQLFTVEKLKKHVRKHWIMAESGSGLHFVTVCFHTTSASGVICPLVTILHTYTMFGTIEAMLAKDYDSDYSWSMVVILIVQSIGVVIGTIAPVCRCFANFSFKVDSKIISKHFKVFEVESYWTSKLYIWKRASEKLPFRSPRKLEVVTESLKRLILRLCMEIQEGVVVLCKIISLVPFVFMIIVVYCKCCLKWLLKAENLDGNKELRPYVLHFEDEMVLADRTLEGLSKSVEQLIKKGEERRPKDLENLIKTSDSGFKGVTEFDHFEHQHAPFLLSKVQDQDQDSWSLPVVTLTTIAISLLEKQSNEVKSLLNSVWEGLRYVSQVEESRYVTYDDVSFRKEVDTLWKEVLYDRKWLGLDIPDPSFKEITSQEIVEWFRDKAKNIDKIKGGRDDDPKPIHRYMYHITNTILRNYQANDDNMVSRRNLFEWLSTIIADITAACLTNLPEVIIKKCHNSAIEKLGDSVKDAALLLGETEEIIKTLYEDDHGKIISNMNPSYLPFINKWRAHLRNP